MTSKRWSARTISLVLVMATMTLGLGTTPAAASPPSASSLGQVAGQDLPFCRDNVLPANDDSSSDAVPVPFALKFFGNAYDTMYVNNNGNVTFGGPLSQYTPSDLTGATDLPIIAPFFADVDTDSAGSDVVTYGSSPDGRTFCVNWADVGYYSGHDDRLNTFQLLLTQNSEGAGRVPGDFDITLNYDQIQWETGDASGGSGGQGGTSAAAGFSAGTGVPGTFVQLPGSFENGALVDGGPNALISSSQNSSQVGRYVFQVRNDGLTSTLGDLQGSVLDGRDSSPVGGAFIQACRTNGTGCTYTHANGEGQYTFTALQSGDYDLQVPAPSNELFGGGAPATVTAGELTTVDPIVLEAPVPLPPNVQMTSNGTGSDGVPSVYYGDPVELQVTGCAGIVNPTYTVRLSTGEILRDAEPMTESPSGTYRATITPFAPDHGAATISTNIPATCGGAPTVFNIYIDPSGIVTDQYGRPLGGATVTLLRADTAAGPFTMVPDGSIVMSPSNRANPDLTDAAGFFQWDVTAGWYQVQAESAGCDTTTTPALEVPPERIDLVIAMNCSAAAPAPTTGPTVSGTPRVGQTIAAVSAVWPSPIEEAGLELLRNGTPLAGTSHQLSPADVGAVFTARSTGRRPDYVTEGGTGDTVRFDSAQATSPGVTGQAGPPAPPPSGPEIITPASLSGTGKVGDTLTVTDPVWRPAPVTQTRQWFRDTDAIAGETGSTYTVVPADLGRTISVRFTTTTPRHGNGRTTSNGVMAIEGDAPVATTPARATGSGKVGTLLTAVEPGWSLPGTSSTGRQWMREGSPIAGETGPTYSVRPGDVGDELAVRYTGQLAGHADGGSTSSTITASKHDSSTAAQLAKQRIRTNRRGRLTVTVTVPDLAAPLGAVEIKDGSEVLTTVTLRRSRRGTLVVRLPRLRRGQHQISASYLGDAATNGSTSPASRLTVVKKKRKRR